MAHRNISTGATHGVVAASGRARSERDLKGRNIPRGGSAPLYDAKVVARPAKWRAALRGTAAAGALLVGYCSVARADCGLDGPTTLECTGDLVGVGVVDGGIVVSATGFDTLIVDDLNGPITPGVGTGGIVFNRTGANNGSVTIDSEADIIVPAAPDSPGIHASVDSGNISITHDGDVATAGDDSSAISAIVGTGSGAGNVTIEHTGELSTLGEFSHGIFAMAGGDIEIVQTGGITTEGDVSGAILLLSTDGDVTVTQTGDVAALGAGGAAAFFAQSDSGDVTVTRTGDLTMYGSGAPALFARSTYGSVAVTQTGNVAMHGIGAPAIFIQAAEDATLEQTGDVTMHGDGAPVIYIFSTGTGDVNLTQTGDVTMFGYGASFAAVTASSISGDITMVHNGDVTALGLAAGAFRRSLRAATLRSL